MSADRKGTRSREEESLTHSAVLVVLCSYLTVLSRLVSAKGRAGNEGEPRKREGGTEGGREESSTLKEGTLQPYKQT